jgi:SAM-dependent methyltransferase
VTQPLPSLSEISYVRKRLTPAIGDEFYIVLSDLRRALDTLVPYDAPTVLDYGCGGSPYRPLFSGRYDRADIETNPDRTITLMEDSILPPDIEKYDLVLSTQVLEHAPKPYLYLTECRRALKPEGVLVLTTHGFFEDHPCPHDYWRWTMEGITSALTEAGLTIVASLKITVGPRAAIHSLERDLDQLCQAPERTSVHSLLFRTLRKLGSRRLHKFADRNFSDFSVQDACNRASGERYVCLGIRARLLT